ncbi:hypothetical protein HID58_042499 [Brassica napus]|uniref:Thymidine kinase n=2 Tax=Brassica TaxID=3705 RepID=A0ABQ8BDW9_BRANA|nr:hypothetical protein HID58_042499 [Brassica napus]
MASSSNPTSCSSTVEVKLPCLVLTGSSPYVKVSPSSLRCLLIPPRDPILSHHHAVAHEGFGFPCLILSDLMSFPARFRQDAYDKMYFLNDWQCDWYLTYEFCCKDADDDGKTVIVAVVDSDYLRRSFADVLKFLPITDSVTKLTARCEVCGQKVFFTVRKTCDTRTELIGGADVYILVFLKHYINNQIVIKASK